MRRAAGVTRRRPDFAEGSGRAGAGSGQLGNRSAAVAEEVLEQGLGLGGADAVEDFGDVVALRMAEDPRALRHAAGFRVGGAVDQPRDAGLADGGGAHRAGFEGDIERVAGQPLAAGLRQASRSARISAWAVGSASSRLRLPARATTSPPGATTTAPTGTSPRSGGGAGLGQGDLHMRREHGAGHAAPGAPGKVLSLSPAPG